MPDTVLVLFTRDLRVRDHPALHEACERGSTVVPLFVLDPDLLARSVNRARFLLDSLRALDGELRRRGGRLVVRRGHVATEAAAVAREVRAGAVHLTADVTRTSAERLEILRRTLPEVEIRTFPGSAVVEAGSIAPDGRVAYQRFTPYFHRWSEAPRRAVLPPPGRVPVPPAIDSDPLPTPPEGGAPALPEGGERAAWRRLDAFLERLERYDAERDRPDLAATSGLSPYLRFGCLSPTELWETCRGLPGADAFLRQLAWRDFFRQLVSAQPELTHRGLRPRAPAPEVPGGFDAWREGRTGLPFVDAAMRQLQREGAIHPRARMVAAAHAARDLHVPWQRGARWFDELLVDGDPAVNAGNWQWVAGVGADPRPGRRFNPARQARRFDPDGAYVRRHVAELRDVPAPLVHAPWTDRELLRRHGYPAPLGGMWP
jgi:deoxyribodipyrimidine photo-lyase